MTPLEIGYLVPDPGFLVALLLVLGVLVVWPLVEALRGRRYGWAVAIVLLSPLAGVLWLAVGRWMRPAPDAPESRTEVPARVDGR